MKKFIIDIINTDKQKYHDVLGKIKKNFETVQTSHLCLVNDAWYKGYEIFIYDGFVTENIRDLTNKELRPIHNIEMLVMANHFECNVEF